MTLLGVFVRRSKQGPCRASVPGIEACGGAFHAPYAALFVQYDMIPAQGENSSVQIALDLFAKITVNFCPPSGGGISRKIL